MPRFTSTLAVLTLSAALAAPLHAQVAADSAAHQPSSAFTFDPLGIPFSWITAEYEGKVGTGTTLALDGSYIGDSGQHIASGDLKLRYYPNEDVLKGFSIGTSVGVMNYSRDVGCVFACGTTNSSATKPTFGVVLDYDWLIGARKQFMIGTGLGAKRIFNVPDSDDFSSTLPEVRLMFGWVF